MTHPPPRRLIAEVISIGDEMTSGARLDTNAQWLSRRLGELGITVEFHSTVGDTLAHNIDVYRAAAARADVVVSTGGLGPTRDDLTREALAALVGCELEFRESAMKHIESLFARRKREMPQRNRVQAMFPSGSDEIFNPQGTAPGIDMSVGRAERPPSRIYALPGVPAEMKRMFDDTVAPRILAQSGGATRIRHLVMKFFGTGESDMEQRLGEMISRQRQPRVGITVSAATISLRITATGETDEACDAMIQRTRAEILELVPELYFGDGEDFEQYHAIDALLRERDESMVVVELGRAAPLGDWFASLGDSPAYRGGLSFSDVEDFQKMFAATAEDDAFAAALDRFDADWILMVDGYPALEKTATAPQGASEFRLVVAGREPRIYSTKVSMGGHPEILHPRIAKAGMAWLRKILAST